MSDGTCDQLYLALRLAAIRQYSQPRENSVVAAGSATGAPEALPLIDGTEVDFVKNGLNEAFTFRNPNVSGECGCGESFNV